MEMSAVYHHYVLKVYCRLFLSPETREKPGAHVNTRKEGKAFSKISLD